LESLASVVENVVTEHGDYFRLTYIDALEFEGKHIRSVFRGLEARFRAVPGLAGVLATGVESSFAFTAMYLAFVNYFLLRHQFGAAHMYRAKDDKAAILQLVGFFQVGVGKPRRTR
jgi:hypothetical protein